jgi:hypothetical protein
MSSSDYAARAAALLEEAGIATDDQDDRGRPRAIRLCLACGERGPARYCPRCGASTLLEGIE